MTDKELKRLSRAELLELLLTQMEENEKLRKQLRKAQAALRDRRIEIENAGSMAEAALRLTCIFEVQIGRQGCIWKIFSGWPQGW